MKATKLSPVLFVVVLIAAFFALSLIIRIALPWDAVFTGEWIKYTGNDAYYQMRIVDNMAANFPSVTEYDPYLIYPSAGGYGDIHFFNWCLSAIAWIIGLGSPTAHTVDVVGVIFPTILAALTIIPTYFIGKMLFNRWAGVFAAGLVAVLPGEFLGRSFLGFTDTHIMEAFLTTTFLAFFIAALKSGIDRKMAFTHLKTMDRKVIIRPLIFSLLAGVFLGLFMITWAGGMLFVFIATIYLIVQFIINHLKKRPSDPLVICSFITFLVTLIIFLPFAEYRDLTLAMVGITLLPLVLAVISYFMNTKNLKPLYFPVALIVLGAILYGAVQLIAPDLVNSAINKFKMVFVPGGPTALTTIEMQPFISFERSYPTAIAWGTYTTDFFFISPVLLFHEASWVASLKWFPGFAFVPIIFGIWFYCKRKGQATNNTLKILVGILLLGLTIWLWFISPAEWKLWFPGLGILAFIILVWQYFRQRSQDQPLLLFFIWTIIALIATLVQRRFNYFFAVNVALLAGYFCYKIVWWAGLRKLAGNAESDAGKTEGAGAKSSKPQEETWLPIHHINVVVAIIAVFTIAFSFNIVEAKEAAWANDPNPTHGPQYGPSDAWQESLIWLKENTPEPFGDADAYYSLFERPAQPADAYPEEAYAVTSWWDYGYWITRIGHRIPSANPSQSKVPTRKVAELLLETDVSEMREKLEEMNTGYVVIDYPMARINKKMHAIITWAGRYQSEFTGYYYITYEGESGWIQVWNPEYYQTLAARLYNFNSQEVNEVLPVVFTYIENTDDDGNVYREVTYFKEFDNYEEAVAYIESQESGNHIIVGINPFVSPIPLEKIDGFDIVYSSSQLTGDETVGEMPEVKIFEYSP